MVDSTTRAEFIAGWLPGGKYDGVVGIYLHWKTWKMIGPFNKEIINAVSTSVKWISQIGAGYDLIDVEACREKGRFPVSLQIPYAPTFSHLSQMYEFLGHQPLRARVRCTLLTIIRLS